MESKYMLVAAKWLFGFQNIVFNFIKSSSWSKLIIKSYFCKLS